MNISKSKSGRHGKVALSARPGSYHSDGIQVAAEKKRTAVAARWDRLKVDSPALAQLELPRTKKSQQGVLALAD